MIFLSYRKALNVEVFSPLRVRVPAAWLYLSRKPGQFAPVNGRGFSENLPQQPAIFLYKSWIWSSAPEGAEREDGPAMVMCEQEEIRA
jgi:hypothetical protein